MKSSLSTQGRIAILVGLLLAFALGITVQNLLPATIGFLEDESGTLTTISEDPAGETARYTGWIAWWTGFQGLMGAFTAVAAYFAYRAFREGQRSADAAVEANQISRENTKSQLRAYVSFEKLSAVYDPSTEVLALSWSVVNRGSTLAKNLQMSVNAEISAHNPAVVRHHFFDGRGGRFSLYPSQKMSGGISFEHIDQSSLENIKSGITFVSLGLVASYKDVFSERHFALARAGIDGDDLYLSSKVKLTLVEPGGIWHD